MIASRLEEVVIYKGSGIFTSSLPQVESLIKKLSSYTVSYVDEDSFSPKSWDPKRTVCVFMGGEASVIEKGIGDRSADLRDFFKLGGRGLFICGSSFAAATNRVYNRNKKEGSLNLFDGSAVGPLYPDEHVTWQNRAVEILWSRTVQKGFVMSIGGGYYIPNNPKATEVLATYNDGKIAAFAERYGSGTIVHSMVHFEETGDGYETNLLGHIDAETKRLFRQRFPQWEEEKTKLSPLFLSECFSDILKILNGAS